MLKKQPQRFLPVSGDEMLLANHFRDLNIDCSAQNSPRELKLEPLKLSGYSYMGIWVTLSDFFIIHFTIKMTQAITFKKMPEVRIKLDTMLKLFFSNL
jgi:hypothetical protein